MRHRSHYPPVTQDPPRPPWPYRHPRMFPAALLTGLVLVSGGLALSIEIEVTVPLLVPLTGALACGLLAHGQLQRRRQAAAAEKPAGMSVDVALAGDQDALIGRTERDVVFALLTDRYATEHLDEDDYSARHTQVLNAKRRRDLWPALEGLNW